MVFPPRWRVNIILRFPYRVLVQAAFFLLFLDARPAGSLACSRLIYALGWREGSRPKYTQNMCFQKQTASCTACSQLPQSSRIYAAAQWLSLTAWMRGSSPAKRPDWIRAFFSVWFRIISQFIDVAVCLLNGTALGRAQNTQVRAHAAAFVGPRDDQMCCYFCALCVFGRERSDEPHPSSARGRRIWERRLVRTPLQYVSLTKSRLSASCHSALGAERLGICEGWGQEVVVRSSTELSMSHFKVLKQVDHFLTRLVVYLGIGCWILDWPSTVLAR